MITTWNEIAEASVTYPRGFKAAAVRSGLKTAGDDLALICCEQKAAAAGVFTTNLVQASCVKHSRRIVAGGSARAILANAGNANACNGEQGDRDTARMAEIVAHSLGMEPVTVLVASTGVIGHLLPMDLLESAIPVASSELSKGNEVDMRLARAIMTTDMRPKLIAVECLSDKWPYPIRIGGICKGSGMIAPNMATMLCFLTTDADIAPALLQRALSSAISRTFNRVTVDGDTSTNDMALLLASGSGGVVIGEDAVVDFTMALERVCLYLARMVAGDGEGATKLTETTVRGAIREEDAVKIGRTIAESPLVKTALFGCDPNWGRILAAIGRSNIILDVDKVDVFLGEMCVCSSGRSIPFDEKGASAYLHGKEIRIIVDLHAGEEQATIYTCDFSYDYVRINAEYHT